MITGVLRERLQRRNEAVANITSSWGGEQNVIGPVLGIPYQYRFKAVKDVAAPDGKMERREVEENGTAIAYFLPETLHITGDVETQMLHRGIYDAAVFRAQVTLSGKFAPPDFGPLKIDVKDLQWKDAFVTIAVNDLRGTREAMVLDWGGSKRPLLPGSQVPGYTTGATASLGDEKPIASETEFSIPLDFNGSEGIYFAPFGVQNEANLKSNWPDPAFRGGFLPAERSVRPDGFDGKWKVSYYGRDYPQSWTSRTGNERFSVLSVTNSRFGVQLLSILDAYRYVERSIKYGVLFLVLVFTTFFLFEVTARQKIHAFQYLLKALANAENDAGCAAAHSTIVLSVESPKAAALVSQRRATFRRAAPVFLSPVKFMARELSFVYPCVWVTTSRSWRCGWCWSRRHATD